MDVLFYWCFEWIVYCFKRKIFFDINIVIILLVNFGKDNYKLLNNGNLMCLFIMYRYDIIVFYIIFVFLNVWFLCLKL